MHDPMTVAFEIKSPINRRSEWFKDGYRETLVTIWHVDPETDGSDDSCDWFGCDKTRENGWFPAMHDDYASMMPDSQRAVDFIWYSFHRKLGRSWWRHPRLHFWHWEIQIHPLQSFKRWAFSRCASCGKGFSWGYCPSADGWGGDGPSWTGEKGVRHNDCHNPLSDGASMERCSRGV